MRASDALALVLVLAVLTSLVLAIVIGWGETREDRYLHPDAKESGRRRRRRKSRNSR